MRRRRPARTGRAISLRPPGPQHQRDEHHDAQRRQQSAAERTVRPAEAGRGRVDGGRDGDVGGVGGGQGDGPRRGLVRAVDGGDRRDAARGGHPAGEGVVAERVDAQQGGEERGGEREQEGPDADGPVRAGTGTGSIGHRASLRTRPVVATGHRHRLMNGGDG
nr:hypothetical protein GCM10025699_40840 [Microbacterium flavescens]